jgi:2-dehydropantoate 2-reductase
VAEELPQADVITGVVYLGAHVVGEGEVNHVAGGTIHIGYTNVPAAGRFKRDRHLKFVAMRLAAAMGLGSATDQPFISCFTEAVASAGGDMRPIIWGKLVINAAINPVAALAGEPNGQVAERPSLRALAQAIAEEGEAVAKAEGVSLPYPSAAEAVLETSRRTAANRCSMLQDLDAGRMTEIDYLNGAIIRAAERHNLSVPANRAITALIRQVTHQKA